MRFKIEVDERDLNKFREMGNQLSNMRVPFQEYVLWFESETKIQIAKEEAPDGTPWVDLAKATWKYKKSKTKLRETSVMVNTIYTLFGLRFGEVGFTSEIAIFHQVGTKKMPQRELLNVTPEREKRGQAIFERYIQSQIGG